jgi:hypothetical protein
MVANNLANIGHGGDRSKSAKALLPVTQKQAAVMLGVSSGSVKRAKVVQDKGVPDLKNPRPSRNLFCIRPL